MVKFKLIHYRPTRALGTILFFIRVSPRAFTEALP